MTIFSKSIKIFLIVLGVFILIFFVALYKKEIKKDYENVDMLFTMFGNAKSVEECKIVSEKIAKLDIKNPGQGAGYTPAFQFYAEHMAYCIGGVALKQNDYNLCLDRELNQEICENGFKLMVENLGFSSEETLTTESITECINFTKEACLNTFLSEYVLDAPLDIDCDSFTSDHERDDCFNFLATINMDPNICSNISSNYLRGKCFHLFAFRDNNISLCDYGEKWLSENCRESLEILRNNDVSICEELKYFYYGSPKSICYTAFAIFNRDPSLCPERKISDNWMMLSPQDNTCERCAR